MSTAEHEQEADLIPGPTSVLIRHARQGDESARHSLLTRFLPLLRKWAHGRLPAIVRDINDTDDFVQIALMKAINQLAGFRSERSGSFLIYLRTTFLNQVRDEARKRRAKPKRVELDENLGDGQSSEAHVDQAIDAERMISYERALGSLPKRQQELVVMRLEFGLSYPEIAAEVESTPDAVRVMVSRAVARLAIRLDELRE